MVNHHYLGYVIEPHIVQLNGLGKHTLTHQRVFSKTAGYFSKKITATDLELIKILDEIDDDYLFRLYYRDGKKKIRTAEFFEKHCSDELFQNEIRPFIEERINKVLLRLRGKVIYKTGNDNNPTSVAMKVSSEKGSVLFHFRRDTEGTRYFPTIKYNGARKDFMYKGAQIVSNFPAWMILDDLLLDFTKDIDGKKLQPFLNKRYIQIPRNAEEAYFSKFVTHLVEKHDVYAEGFSITTSRPDGKTRLTVQPSLDEKITLKLGFEYNHASFTYESEQQVCALVYKQDTDYIFKRIKRNRDWETTQRELLESMGLKYLGNAYFTIPVKTFAERDAELIPIETTNKYAFIEWLNINKDELEKNHIGIIQSDELNKYFIGHREVKIEVKEQKDWFDIHAVVKFGNFTFPFIALKEYILKGKREFILPNGLIAVIPDEWFGNLSGILEFSNSDEDIKLEKHHIGLIDELQINNGKYLRLSDKLEKIKHYGAVKESSIPDAFNGILRPYQKAGFDWFYFLKENHFGGCLADDMGLGKTIQTLAMLQKEKELYLSDFGAKQATSVAGIEAASNPGNNEHKQLNLFDAQASNSVTHVPSGLQAMPAAAPHSERSSTPIKTSLIIVPNSLVYNWYSEAKKFTPDIKVYIYTGIQREKNPQLFIQYDLIITTYGTVRVDIDLLKDYKFNYIILDESQSIKNPNAQSTRAVKQLKSSHKLVLTGTPIENSVQELWSQLSFVNPGLLGSLSSFTERFVVPIERNKDEHKMQQLKAIIKPFILRRTKDQVAKELPLRNEQVIYCNMTDEQHEAYETVKSYFRNEILKSIKDIGFNRSQFAILQGLTRLRQIANHPVLTNPEYIHQSGKFDEITAMAETARTEGHKVLIFSQFVKQLELYRTYFDNKQWSYCYLDGSMSNEQRKKQVDTFQQDTSVSFFLLSLKAGGVGLNLTAADYVFIIDPWWNPAVEQQAIDRTHRIGQTKNVFTYKFITKDSVEEKILALQDKKKHLASSIITTEESFIKTIDMEEIIDILS